MDKYGFIDSRDSMHNNSFAGIAFWIKNNKVEVYKYINPIRQYLVRSIYWRIKNPDYNWSNSGSDNEVENTILKRLTYWLWKHFMKPFGWDLKKGTNPDQEIPYIIFCCLEKNEEEISKFIKGLWLRLGFFCNGEHLLWKPSSLAPIYRLHNRVWLYSILDFTNYISSLLEIKKSILQGKNTTNKIRLYLYLVHAEVTNTETKWTKKTKEKILNSSDMLVLLDQQSSKSDYQYWITHRSEAFQIYFEKVFNAFFHADSIVYQNMPYNLLK